MEAPRPTYPCLLCHVGFDGYTGAMQVRAPPLCGHFYHEVCTSKFLRGRCDGVTRCLVCGLDFYEDDFIYTIVLGEPTGNMANSVCWICNEELRKRSPHKNSPWNDVFGPYTQRGSAVTMLKKCKHFYHKECLEVYIRGFKEGMMMCGHCDTNIEGRLMRYKRFRDSEEDKVPSIPSQETAKKEPSESASGAYSQNKSFSSYDRR